VKCGACRLSNAKSGININPDSQKKFEAIKIAKMSLSFGARTHKLMHSVQKTSETDVAAHPHRIRLNLENERLSARPRRHLPAAS
jgi:hypothetical protein